MARFFNYDSPGAAEIYDRYRHAMEADVIAGLLHVHRGKPLKDIHVLDAGCGTGNYSKALIDLGVGKLSLLDANSEMLKAAKGKLKDAIGRKIVDVVVQATLPELPFSDGQFDAVMFNATLHQLDAGNTTHSTPLMEKTLQGTKRILRPKGLLVITTLLPTYLREAFWYMQVHPGVTEKMAQTIVPAKHYMEIFEKYRFSCVAALNFLSATKSVIKEYNDPEGPLKEDWILGTNEFGLAEEREIREMKDKLLDLKEKGKLREFMVKHDRTLEMGISTLFVCVSD